MNNHFFIGSLDSIDLYFDGNLSWGASKNNSETVIYADNPFFSVFCLPLLKINFLTFKKEVLSFLESNFDDTINKFNTFPLKAFITTALDSKSDYWAELALSWIPHIGIDVNAKLLALSKDKYHSQKIRHAAKTLFFHLR